MQVNPKELAILLSDVEKEDPIDFADIPFPEDDLREIVVRNLCQMAGAMHSLTPDERFMAVLAAAAKLVLENLVLQARLLSRDGVPIETDVNDLMARLRKARGN